MNQIERRIKAIKDSRQKLPWEELEAEATRQGCSPADIFFDLAGRAVPGLTLTSTGGPARASSPAGRPTTADLETT